MDRKDKMQDCNLELLRYFIGAIRDAAILQAAMTLYCTPGQTWTLEVCAREASKMMDAIKGMSDH